MRQAPSVNTPSRRAANHGALVLALFAAGCSGADLPASSGGGTAAYSSSESTSTGGTSFEPTWSASTGDWMGSGGVRGDGGAPTSVGASLSVPGGASSSFGGHEQSGGSNSAPASDTRSNVGGSVFDGSSAGGAAQG